jgi:hypothetical protein
MEALWEAKESIKALQEPAESMTLPIDGHCGSSLRTVSQRVSASSRIRRLSKTNRGRGEGAIATFA